MSVHSVYPAGRVVRFHTIGGTQTVADHSWGVVMLLFKLHPNPSIDLLKAAAYHDAPEQMTGDVPYPAKRGWGLLNTVLKNIEAEIHLLLDTYVDLSIEEQCWLKAVDMLELVLYSQWKAEEGNQRYAQLVKKGTEILKERTNTPKEVLECLNIQ